MNRIPAAEHLIIETHPDAWRLITFNEEGDERGLLEARTDRPFRYAASFATSRRLPRSGTLTNDLVWQVVLGWSNDDDAWHLGLVLASDLATARGSRWCEIARWPDPDPVVFEDLARDAAESLAQILGSPLNVVEPRDRRAGTAQPALPDMPLEVGMWALNRDPNGELEFKRSSRWLVGKVTRILWYLLLIAMYLLLSLATLNSDLALPNAGTMLPSPELLPYLGLIVAAVLTLFVFYNLYEISTKPDRIRVSGAKHTVAALKGNSTRWRMNGNDLESIYVTQVVNRRGSKNTIYEAQINLYLKNGKFHKVVEQDKKEEETDELRNNDVVLTEEVLPLTRFSVHSDAQAAALAIAEELDALPCWYDRRTR